MSLETTEGRVAIGAGGGVEAAAGGEGGDAGGTAEGLGIGLLDRPSPPLVAQPATNVQHALNANQKVADRFDRRIVKNLQGFESV
jgi:hypothetical protein